MTIVTTNPLSIEMKKGATTPALSIKILKDSDDLPFDLSGASALFYMKKHGSSTRKIDGASATITDPTGGILSYSWVSGDTDEEGKFRGEFWITLQNGKNLKIPTDDYIDIYVLEVL